LGSVTASAFEQLYEGDGQFSAVAAASRSHRRDLAIDHTLDGVAASLENAFLQVEDAAIMLRDYSSRIEAEPGRIAACATTAST